MPLIYEPKGKAREYSPLALNVYTRGCEHRCGYCYCRGIGAWGDAGKPRNLIGLKREAETCREQILLSFMSDPYAPIERQHRNTRAALHVLSDAACSVAVLTKGGTRCLDDLDLFCDWPDGRIKVGATLTLANALDSRSDEPGAALPEDRVVALRELHRAGVQTWVSIEPVIDPEQSLEMIRRSLEAVDAYKVGKLNHRRSNTDWREFGIRAVEMIREAGKSLYVKHDLRAQLPAGFCTPGESDMNTLTLPARPAQRQFEGSLF